MWKNNTSLSLTVILFIVLSVFNLVYASSLVSSDKPSNADVPKGGLRRKDEGSYDVVDLVDREGLGHDNISRFRLDKVKVQEGTCNRNQSHYRENAMIGDITDSENGSNKNDNVSLNGKMSAAIFETYNDDRSDEDRSDEDEHLVKMVEEFDSDEAIAHETFTDEKSNIRRSLKAGDIFTPYELLPVTERLLKKVELPPGVGRGIVSASKNKEDLADKIFANYFMTTKRIVILKDEDIVGLDALQALAIEGDPENYKYMVRTMSKYPKIMIRRPDKEIESHLPPKRSRYKLLTKKETKVRKAAEYKHAKQQRRQLLSKLQKKMPKNRHVVVNPKNRKRKRGPKWQSLRRALLEPGCTWQYECRDPKNLETCHLKAKCDNKTLSEGLNMEDTVKQVHLPEEEVRVSDSFRRAVGLSVMDEEVQKIIATHILYLRPENLIQQNYHLESVEQYFNMLMARHGSTTPLTPIKYPSTSWRHNNTKKKKLSQKLHSYIPFGVPFRRNKDVTSTMKPTPDKYVNQSNISNVKTTKHQYEVTTMRIVKLNGRG